jgi:hypothetical protein
MADLDTKLMASGHGSAMGYGSEVSLRELLGGSEGGGDSTRFLAGDGTLRTPASGGSAGNVVTVAGRSSASWRFLRNMVIERSIRRRSRRSLAPAGSDSS